MGGGQGFLQEETGSSEEGHFGEARSRAEQRGGNRPDVVGRGRYALSRVQLLLHRAEEQADGALREGSHQAKVEERQLGLSVRAHCDYLTPLKVVLKSHIITQHHAK